MCRSYPRADSLSRFKTSLLLLTISLALTACGNVKPAPYGEYSPDLRSGGKPWELHVDHNSGRVVMEATLAKYDRTFVVLQQNPENRLATIIFSDADCDFGHEVSIWYQGLQAGIGQHLYFDQPIPWGDAVNLAVQWHSDGSLLVRLNDEEKRAKLVGSPQSVTLRSNGIRSEPVRIHYSAAQ